MQEREIQSDLKVVVAIILYLKDSDMLHFSHYVK